MCRKRALEPASLGGQLRLLVVVSARGKLTVILKLESGEEVMAHSTVDALHFVLFFGIGFAAAAVLCLAMGHHQNVRSIVAGAILIAILSTILLGGVELLVASLAHLLTFFSGNVGAVLGVATGWRLSAFFAMGLKA